jgi:ketosteroid isomerase-like protein
MSDIDANKALVRRYFDDFFNGRDVRGADELCATDYLEHAVAPFGDTEPGPVNGPEHLKDTMRWLTEQYPDVRMNVEALVAEGDMVVARVLSYGTNLGKLNGVMKPTGKCFSARQTHWFRVAGGKLAEHWATREDLPAMLQLGVVKPPERRAA